MHRGLINEFNGLLYQYLRRIKRKIKPHNHIKAHAKKRKGKDRQTWLPSDILNYVVDKLADWNPNMQTTLLAQEGTNLDAVYHVDTSDILLGCIRAPFYFPAIHQRPCTQIPPQALPLQQNLHLHQPADLVQISNRHAILLPTTRHQTTNQPLHIKNVPHLRQAYAWAQHRQNSQYPTSPGRPTCNHQLHSLRITRRPCPHPQ